MQYDLSCWNNSGVHFITCYTTSYYKYRVNMTLYIMFLGYRVKEKVIYIVNGIKLHVYMYFNEGCHTHCLIFNTCILCIFCFGQMCLINVAFLNLVNYKTEPLRDGFSQVDESNCFLFFSSSLYKEP